MRALIIDGFIIGLSPRYGVEISKEEEAKIMAAIDNQPEPAPGYTYKLNTEFIWQPIEIEPVESDDDTDE